MVPAGPLGSGAYGRDDIGRCHRAQFHRGPVAGAGEPEHAALDSHVRTRRHTEDKHGGDGDRTTPPCTGTGPGCRCREVIGQAVTSHAVVFLP